MALGGSWKYLVCGYAVQRFGRQMKASNKEVEAFEPSDENGNSYSTRVTKFAWSVTQFGSHFIT